MTDIHSDVIGGESDQTSQDTAAALMKAAVADAKARKARETAKKVQGGAYTAMLNAGKVAGTLAVFDAAWGDLKARIQSGADGLAETLSLKAGSKPGTYRIPNNLSVAANTVRDALEFGVLKDSFNATKEAVAEAKAAKEAADSAILAEAKAEGAEKASLAVVRLCGELAKVAEGFTASEAADACEVLSRMIAIARGERGEDQEAAKAA